MAISVGPLCHPWDNADVSLISDGSYGDLGPDTVKVLSTCTQHEPSISYVQRFLFNLYILRDLSDSVDQRTARTIWQILPVAQFRQSLPVRRPIPTLPIAQPGRLRQPGATSTAAAAGGGSVAR